MSEQKIRALLVGDKSVDEWDHQWMPKGILSRLDLNALHGRYGLYRAYLDEELVYLGVASEYSKRNKPGFYKRLNNYLRTSDSARDTKAGRLMFEHRDQLLVEIIDLGRGLVPSIIADMLEAPMLVIHKPKWNSHGVK